MIVAETTIVEMAIAKMAASKCSHRNVLDPPL